MKLFEHPFHSCEGYNITSTLLWMLSPKLWILLCGLVSVLSVPVQSPDINRRVASERGASVKKTGPKLVYKPEWSTVVKVKYRQLTERNKKFMIFFLFTFVLCGCVSIIVVFFLLVILPLSTSSFLFLFIIALTPSSPCHLVLFLQSPTGVGKPCGNLSEGHLGDNGQHDLLTFGGVWVLPVFL